MDVVLNVNLLEEIDCFKVTSHWHFFGQLFLSISGACYYTHAAIHLHCFRPQLTNMTPTPRQAVTSLHFIMFSPSETSQTF